MHAALKYARNPSSNYIELDKIRECLKGIYAEIVRVAKELSLRASPRDLVSIGDTHIAFEGPIPYLGHFRQTHLFIEVGWSGMSPTGATVCRNIKKGLSRSEEHLLFKLLFVRLAR